MDINKLLNKSKLSWDGSIESLKLDFENIVRLIESLPEPKDLDYSNLIQHAPLAKDEYDKKAEKKDIIQKGDMYKI